MPNQQPTDGDSREDEDEDRKENRDDPRSQQCRVFALPEVAVFLYFLPLVTQYPVVQFWLYDHFSKDYNFTAGNDSSYCSNSSKGSDSDLEEKVQSETNRYVMYTSFISNFVAIFPTLLIGPLTDRYGRKFVFYISTLGLSCSLLLDLFIFHFNLMPALLCVSSLIQGLSGSYGLFLAACFGMAADITSPGKQRALRVTTIEATLAVASSIATTTAGIWVKEVGYVLPMAVCIGELFLAVLFVLFLIPETLAERHSHPFSCKTLLKSFEFYVKDTPDKRRFKLIVCLICFLTMLWTLIGESNFGLLYLLHKPFCWAKVQISVFSGALSLLKWLSAVSFIVLGKRWVSAPVFALIGSVSASSGFLLRGLAKTDVMIFVAAGASLLMEMVGPMCRTMLSKAVSPNEQGALFAGIGVLQMIVSTVSGVVMSNVYNVGLSVYLGLPYLVLAGLVSINIFLLIALIIRSRRHSAAHVPVDDDDERLIT